MFKSVCVYGKKRREGERGREREEGREGEREGERGREREGGREIRYERKGNVRRLPTDAFGKKCDLVFL